MKKIILSLTYLFLILSARAQLEEVWTAQEDPSTGGTFLTMSVIGINEADNGNIYMAGRTHSGFDLVIVKYNSNGVKLATHQEALLEQGVGAIKDMKFDDNGQIYLLVSERSSGSDRDFLVKYSTQLVNNWLIDYLYSTRDEPGESTTGFVAGEYAATRINAMEVDGNGNVYLAGTIWGDYLGAEEYWRESDGYIAKFNSSGTLLWESAQDYNYQFDEIISIKLTSDENHLYATGLTDDVSINSNALTQKYSVSSNSSASLVWEEIEGGPQTNDEGFVLSIDENDDALVFLRDGIDMIYRYDASTADRTVVSTDQYVNPIFDIDGTDIYHQLEASAELRKNGSAFIDLSYEYDKIIVNDEYIFAGTNVNGSFEKNGIIGVFNIDGTSYLEESILTINENINLGFSDAFLDFTVNKADNRIYFLSKVNLEGNEFEYRLAAFDFCVQPSLTVPEDLSFCTTQTSTLSANSDQTVDFTWTNGVSTIHTSSGTSSSVDVSPSATTTYYISIENADGCVSSDEITITVDSEPEVFLEIVDNEGCGEPTLIATPGFDNYRFVYEGFLDLTNGPWNDIGVQFGYDGYYEVTATTSSGCEAVAGMDVTIYDASNLDYFWVGGSGSWEDTDHWATTSGGNIKHPCPPRSSNDVIFDENSFSNAIDNTVEIIYGGYTGYARSLDFSALDKELEINIWSNSSEIEIGHSTVLSDYIKLIGNYHFNSEYTGTKTLNTANADLSEAKFTFNSTNSGSTFELTNDLIVPTLVFYSGQFESNGYSINSEYIYAGGTDLVMDLSNSTITTETLRFDDITPENITQTGAEFVVSGGQLENTTSLVLSDIAISGSVLVYNSSEYGNMTLNPGATLTIQLNQTLTLANLSAVGTSDDFIYISSNGNPANISINSGTIDGEFLYITKINAIGGATFNAFNSVDGGNNTGWNFTSDTEAPEFNASFPSVENISLTSAQVDIQLNEPGVVFYVLLTDASPAPTVDQILAGVDSELETPLAAGNLDVSSANVTETISLEGLSNTSSYDIYLVAEDEAIISNVQSNYTLLSFTTLTPNSAPTVTSPIEDIDEQPTFESISVNLDNVFSDPDEDDLSYSTESSNESVVTVDVSGNSLTITEIGLGSSTITVTADDGNGETVEDEFVMSVTKLDQSITFEPLSDRIFGDTDFELSGASDSGLEISYESSNTAVATISNQMVSIVGVGTTTITASQSGNQVYNAAEDVVQSLTINKADQSITFGTLPSKTFGDENFELEATSDSGLGISFNSSDESVATIDGTTISIVGAGETIITASQSGNENYNMAENVDRSLLVSKADQIISFSEINDTAIDEIIQLTASSSSELEVSYGVEGPASLDGNELTVLDVGTITVTASQAGNDNYNPAEDVIRSFEGVFEKLDQTISFEALEDRTFGDEPFELSATASSGLAVSFSSSNESIASISDNSVSILAAGEVTITAVQGGDDVYNTAEPLQQTLTILKADQSITFGPLEDRTFGDASFSLGAVATSGLEVSYESSNTGIVSIDDGNVEIMGTGTVMITASQSGNENYNAAAPVIQNLTVHKADPMIIFDPASIPDQLLSDGGTSLDIYADPYEELSVSIKSGPATIENTGPDYYEVTFIDVGEVTIEAVFGETELYNGLASELSFSIVEVARETQSISFDPLQEMTYGDDPFVLSASATSGLQVAFASSNESVASINGSTVTIHGAGETTITASQSGNDDFQPAIDVVQELIISKANQIISFDPISNRQLNDPDFELNANSSSGLEVTYSSSDENIASIEGSMVSIIGVGEVTITASQIGNSNYNPAEDVTQSFEVSEEGVEKLDQTITFEALEEKTFGDESFELTASANSGLEVTYYSSDESVATISDNLVTIIGAGETTITARQSGNDEYSPASEVQQVLIVSKANQTISFDPIANKLLTDEAFELSANATSGLEITFSSSNENVATVTDMMVTILGVGEITITAGQPGNNNYNPATEVTQSFEVIEDEKLNQSISFEALEERTFGDESFELTASSSSGLDISYSSSDESVATISGNVVTITGAGETTIMADQPGNDEFNPAESMSQILLVNKANQTISFDEIEDKFFGDDSFELSATASSQLPISWSSSSELLISISGSVATIIGIGEVTITASQSGDDNYNPAPDAEQSFTIREDVVESIEDLNGGWEVFPNPVVDHVTVRLEEINEFDWLIFDQTGTIVKRGYSHSNNAKIGMEDMASGLYLIQVQHTEGQQTIRLLK